MQGGVRKRGTTWSYYFDLGKIDGKRKKKEKYALQQEEFKPFIGYESYSIHSVMEYSAFNMYLIAY